MAATFSSDIYDLTNFTNELVKKHMDEVDEETLFLNTFGMIADVSANMMQNAVVTSGELSNEAIPTRAKFDRNVITHALSVGIKDINATPSRMKVIVFLPEISVIENMTNNQLIIDKDAPISFDGIEFHFDYDILVNRVKLSNGSYVYSAMYDLNTRKNPISNITNPYLPPVQVFRLTKVSSFIGIMATITQVEYTEIYTKILTDNMIENKTFTFDFENQLAGFDILVTDPDGDTKYLDPIYDGLYDDSVENYCYYSFVDANTIRIKFNKDVYEPVANSEVTVRLYTTQGAGGNFTYKEDKIVTINPTNRFSYNSLYMLIRQRGDNGSFNGEDRATVAELQKKIPKEALARGSVTNATDLNNYFNQINTPYSMLKIFRKRDNQLERLYYTYNLIKDKYNNIVPTNTIDVQVPLSIFNTTEQNASAEYGLVLTPGKKIYFAKTRYIITDRTELVSLSDENIHISYVNDQLYTGQPIHPTVIVRYGFDELIPSKDYLVSYEDNIDESSSSSRAKIIISGIEEFTIDPVTKKKYGGFRGSAVREFSIKKYIDPDLYIFPIEDQAYMGAPVEILPKQVILRNGKGEILPSDQYSYAVFNNEDIGYGVVEVKEFNNEQILFNEFRIFKRDEEEYRGFIHEPNIENNYENQFIYTNPFTIKINQNPLYASYYIDIIHDIRYLEFRYTNNECPIQFVASAINVDRNFYSDRDTYKVTVDLGQNIVETTEQIIKYDENGNITENNLKVILLFYKQDGYTKPLRYKEGYLTAIESGASDFGSNIYTYEFDFKTDNTIDSANQIDILDMNEAIATSGAVADQLFPDTVYAEILVFINSSQYNNDPVTMDKYQRCIPNLDNYVLCNVYRVTDGIKLFYNYTDAINSAVTITNYTDGNTRYNITKVPLIKYDYIINEERMKYIIDQIKLKLDYITSCVDKLETTFGIDYKLFNTYGPSNIFYIGDGTDEIINRVNLTMTFNLKLYSSSDSGLVNYIIRDIKEYMEVMDDIHDLHMPNLITLITNKYREQIVYFEFVDINGYGPGQQHIIKDENFETTSKTPEFLNINTLENDVPDITINLM